MNKYIADQIKIATSYLDTFKQACFMAAMQDDGKVDGAEKKLLDSINSLTDDYTKKLSKLK